MNKNITKIVCRALLFFSFGGLLLPDVVIKSFGIQVERKLAKAAPCINLPPDL